MGAVGYPDPVISASIYCSGDLDVLVERVIAPFWQIFRARPETSECYLWFLRYDKSGEHLKIRLHGPEDLRSEALELLRSTIDLALDDLPPAKPTEPQAAAPFPIRVAPIDAEDNAESPPEDRTWALTQYQRSPVSLGPYPFTDDEEHLIALTRCLGRGAEEVLAAACDGSGEGLAGQRQSCLLNLLIVALSVLGPEKAEYIRYHRDWLIRLPLLKSSATDEHGRSLVQRFEDFCEQRSEQLELLQQWTQEAWAAGAIDGSDAEESMFHQAFVDYIGYLRSRTCKVPNQLDPFAPSLVFPLLLKALNGIANQVGISRFEEAFTLHMLLRVADPASRSDLRFSLFPFAEPFT